MTETPRPLVVDTSVAVKFYLPEEFMEEARRLRDTVDDGLVEMIAPNTIQPEFWNALWQKRRREELSPEEARSIWEEFAEDPIALYKPEDLMPRAIEVADTGVIIYDALFIALAEATNTVVTTADDRLLRTLKGTPFARHARHISNVGDFVASG